MRSTFEDKMAKFCGGGIALSAAWEMATLPEPFISAVVDKGVAATGAAIGTVLLLSLANDLRKSAQALMNKPDDNGSGPV